MEKYLLSLHDPTVWNFWSTLWSIVQTGYGENERKAHLIQAKTKFWVYFRCIMHNEIIQDSSTWRQLPCQMTKCHELLWFSASLRTFLLTYKFTVRKIEGGIRLLLRNLHRSYMDRILLYLLAILSMVERDQVCWQHNHPFCILTVFPPPPK